MYMRSLWVTFVVLAGISAQAQTANAGEPSAPKGHFSTPAVDAGDYVYVSAQGPRRTDGSLPTTFSDQVRQALENVNSALRTLGLTKNNVVYTQVCIAFVLGGSGWIDARSSAGHVRSRASGDAHF